ncbi:putative thiazole biosynthetic enzyme [termite gut metagenome]|uniref:Putative thiazole biosynthetic enzyme n=1 Tax=termite gut metagenome TaxID=433724 RepID=A0A5J4R714_9ZZZZ
MITRRDFIKITAASGALASVGKVSDARATMQPVLPRAEYAFESKRRIPVIAEVDIIVVGGSSRAVAAASAAAKAGCNVFLVAQMPYLGDDICGSFFYEQATNEKLQTALARRVFPGKAYPTPLHVKTVLEHELIDKGVNFLYCSYVTDAIVDESGKVAGIALVNRSGRQSIRCKALIDATHTASVATLFGATKSAFRPGAQEFQFTVVGNSPKEALEITKCEVLPQPLTFEGKIWSVTRYTFSLPLNDDSYASLMQAEQRIRTLTWDADQVDSADLLWYVPQQSIHGKQSYTGNYASLRKLPEEAFIPKGIPSVWVISPSADIPRSIVTALMRPANGMFLGSILGERIADKVQSLPAPDRAVVRRPQVEGFNYGEIGETLKPLRLTQQKGYVDSPEGVLPVLGSYDVVTLGGGTAGSTAAISAAQQGVKTLALEYLHGLGGLGTLGMIGRYWDGYRGGYTAVIDKSLHEMAPLNHPRQIKDWQEESVADWKMEWLRRELLKAGGELWFGVLGCGALRENNQVKGLVVATPFGRGVILSKVLIDSTGSADIAIAAGASFDYTGRKTLAVQGAGTGHVNPGDSYNNNDWLFVDDTDVLDISRAFIQAKIKVQGKYDVVKMPQTRERRRVVAEYMVSVYDVLNHRRYPDTISYHQSSFDTHGMIVDPYFILSPPEERHTIYNADVPLRSLLPKGLEGILCIGLGAGAHRDAMPVIRMRSCLQSQGHSVGYLAAVAAKEGKPLRKTDIKKIQKHLVEIGNLPERVLTDKEFKGFSSKELQAAAGTVSERYKGLEILLTDTPRCINLIKKKLASDVLKADESLIYASILCMLGESTLAHLLAGAISKQPDWDKGWHYTGMGQFGMSLSHLDALLIALGRAKVASTLPVVLEKARLLEPENEFSHYRAVAMAAESIGSREAAPVLAELLRASGMRHHAIRSYAEVRSSVVPGMEDVSTRNIALKELHLAGALYLCGDADRLGETILRQYADGLQGHYARYASELLNLT